MQRRRTYYRLALYQSGKMRLASGKRGEQASLGPSVPSWSVPTTCEGFAGASIAVVLLVVLLVHHHRWWEEPRPQYHYQSSPLVVGSPQPWLTTTTILVEGW